MIQRENAPTLCPRCVNFVKVINVGCRIGNYGIETDVAKSIQGWLSRQTDESSWTYMGACPSFQNNGSSPHLMSSGDQAALRRLLRL